MEAIPIKFNGKTYYGFKKCPLWLKKKYKEAVGKCECCNSKENLEIHRPKRGADGGLYTLVPKGHPLCNWQVLCSECHKFRNYSRRNNYQNSVKSQVIYK